ncbi:RES family NAD+ phosphorylase [Duganella sp.]|uniref:RES family NAD+ phosphorylase n=1 Tax=Duganella sp. TaxID=1904440 RepID=UPI0039C8B9BE
MRLWRITLRKYALDKSCAGAAHYGGRWNPVGMPALYCGTSIAITALEKFVHIASTRLPLVLVAVDIPDETSIYEPDPTTLPAGWDALPTSASAQAFGGAWLASNANLALKIPSAILPEEANVMVNPRHPDYPAVKLTVVRPFTFDPRMGK